MHFRRDFASNGKHLSWYGGIQKKECLETWCFPPLLSNKAGGGSARLSWLSVWVSILSMQSNQERARHPFPGRDGEFLWLNWCLWVGRIHSIPSSGKASMKKMSKAREDGDFPLPNLSLGAQAGIACLSKEGSRTRTHVQAPFKNNLEILGPR